MTRRTLFTGSASGRRRERRAALQSEVSSSADVMHCPTPSRAVLTLSRKVDRVAKALIAHDTKIYDSADNRCLPQVALYSAGFRKSENITAR